MRLEPSAFRFVPTFSAARLSAAIALAAGLGWQSVAEAHQVFYQARSTGIRGTITVNSLKKSLLVMDLGMACDGTPREETVSSVTNPSPMKVSAKNVRGYTIGRDDTAASNTEIDSVLLEVPGLKVEASALTARAQASCDALGKYSHDGGATIATLKINGEGRTISGEKNQKIEIPNVATIIVNETMDTYSREYRSTALHVILFNEKDNAFGDFAFAYARAKITCQMTN